ncbi:MAG: hypothetical protein JXB23_07440 [Candidatus Aminicenantes bacterium]|nr:hypothetical protein [Candidatus Aminicenantes bacterium]
MPSERRVPLGLIVISVIMLFTALATDLFWFAKLIGQPFSETMPVGTSFYNAFATPDILMSLFLYAGAVGLLKLRKWGLGISLVGMGMWLFDSLLVLGITGTSRINIVGPSLFFSLFTAGYLLIKKNIFD